jgi:hypothetical protein
VWQRLRQQGFEYPFNFEQVFDQTKKMTEVSVLRLLEKHWSSLPLRPDQVDYLTAPNIMSKYVLPHRASPFTLLAYRWLGRIELSAYRMGLLQYTQQGADTPEGAWTAWSQVVQAMPVLAAAPLYTPEASLTSLFQPHHRMCRTLSFRRGVIGKVFQHMKSAVYEPID